jgi:hypothetical protein
MWHRVEVIDGATSQKTAFFDIKIDLREIGWNGIDWIDQWRALVNTVMDVRVP